MSRLPVATMWAWKQVLPSKEKLVLLALAFHMNEDETECWPGQERLAAMAGCSKRAVQDALLKLEDHKLIVRSRVDGLVTHYHMQIQVVVSKPRKRQPKQLSDAEDVTAKLTDQAATLAYYASPPVHNMPPNLPSELTKDSPDATHQADSPPPSQPLASATQVATVSAKTSNVVTFPTQPSPPSAPAPIDARGQLWGIGVTELCNMSGKTGPQIRKIVGCWLRDLKDDASIILLLIATAQAERKLDAMAWLHGAVHARAKMLRERPYSAAQIEADWGLKSFASPAALAWGEASD